MSDGTFETETLWRAEKEGLLAFYNGDDAVQHYVQAVEEAELHHLYGTADVRVSEGLLSVKMPPHSLLVLSKANGESRGVFRDGILYRSPVADGAIRCESDAVAALYKFFNGKPELFGIYRNGDAILDREGVLRFFRWDKMQPKE